MTNRCPTRSKFLVQASSSSIGKRQPLEVDGTALEVPLHLPTCARTRLVLELPVGKRPEIAGGMVLASPGDIEQGAASGMLRWVVGIGQSPAAVLRIVDTAGLEVGVEKPDVTVDESLHYDVTSRGIDLETRLLLNANQSPPSQLSATLPAGLRLIDAKANKRPLAWSVTAIEASGGTNRATIELPAFPPSGELTVVLHAWGAAPFGESTQLPKVSLEGSFWTAGSIQLAARRFARAVRPDAGRLRSDRDKHSLRSPHERCAIAFVSIVLAPGSGQAGRASASGKWKRRHHDQAPIGKLRRRRTAGGGNCRRAGPSPRAFGHAATRLVDRWRRVGSCRCNRRMVRRRSARCSASRISLESRGRIPGIRCELS